QLGDLEAELLEVPQGMANGVVLDRGRHDAVPVRLARPGGALEGEVVGFGATRREDDLARLRVEPRGDPLVGLVERRPGTPAERVGRAGIAERVRQVRHHRGEYFGPERRRRGVIEVDRHRPRLYAAGRPGPAVRCLYELPE